MADNDIEQLADAAAPAEYCPCVKCQARREGVTVMDVLLAETWPATRELDDMGDDDG